MADVQDDDIEADLSTFNPVEVEVEEEEIEEPVIYKDECVHTERRGTDTPRCNNCPDLINPKYKKSLKG